VDGFFMSTVCVFALGPDTRDLFRIPVASPRGAPQLMLVSANLLMTGVAPSIFTDDFWLFYNRLEWREPNILEALRNHPTNKGYLFVDQCFDDDECKRLLNVLHSSSFAPSNARKFTRK
jgi:hypothetical protein